MKSIAFAIPVFNEGPTVVELLGRLDEAAKQVAASRGVEVSLLAIDDGSTDGSVEKIRAFRFQAISRATIKRLSRNFGHTAAVAACLDHCREDAVVLMDADLQDDPGLIPQMVDAWLDGAKAVRVVRGRRAEGAGFGLASGVFYWLFHGLTGLPKGLGTFGLYDRRVYEELRRYPEAVCYFPGLISLVGFKSVYLRADRRARHSGRSKVGWLRLTLLATRAILSFSAVPIYLVTGIGILVSVASFLAGLIVIGIRVFTNAAIPGWASFLTAQFFLAGVIIFSLGLIGQYVGIILEEVKARPRYIVDDETG